MLARLLLVGGLVLLQLGAAQQLEEIEAQIEALYKAHNPDKVDNIPGLRTRRVQTNVNAMAGETIVLSPQFLKIRGRLAKNQD